MILAQMQLDALLRVARQRLIETGDFAFCHPDASAPCQDCQLLAAIDAALTTGAAWVVDNEDRATIDMMLEHDGGLTFACGSPFDRLRKNLRLGPWSGAERRAEAASTAEDALTANPAAVSQQSESETNLAVLSVRATTDNRR